VQVIIIVILLPIRRLFQLYFSPCKRGSFSTNLLPFLLSLIITVHRISCSQIIALLFACLSFTLTISCASLEE
jgi:hypothetical protein